MKKFLIILIAIVTAFSLTACLFAKPQNNTSPGFSSNDEEDESSKPDDGDKPSEKPDDDGEPSEAPASASAEAEDESLVFVDESDIRITAPTLELTDEFWGPELKVLIENDTDQDVTVQVLYATVNGLMVTTMLSCDVQAGKKANDSIVFDSESLAISGIEKVADVELIFEIYDTETWETVFIAEPVYLTVPDNASYVQQIDDTGSVAVDEDGYKIVIQELDTENTYYGADLYVYIENNTDQAITVQCDEVSVNGFMIYPYFYGDLLPGTKMFTMVNFFETDLTDNGITDISEIELTFYVYDLDTWDTLYESDPIVLTY